MDPSTITGILVALVEGAKFLKKSTQIALETIRNGSEIRNHVKSAYHDLKTLLISENKVEDYVFKGLEKDPNSSNRKGTLEEELKDNLPEKIPQDSELARKIEQLISSLEKVENIPKETQKTIGLNLQESKRAFISYRKVIAEPGTTAIYASKSEDFKAEGEELITKSSSLGKS